MDALKRLFLCAMFFFVVFMPCQNVNTPLSFFEHSNWMGRGFEKNFVSDSGAPNRCACSPSARSECRSAGIRCRWM